MDPHRLKCFIAVFERGNVSAAAQALNMTQPPLSILIRKLEEELQVKLFRRESNRLVPTQTGELFYMRAKELLAGIQSIRREVLEHHGGSRGTVRVGCSTAASLFIVPSVIEGLAAKNREITVQVHEGETAYLIQRLRERQLDLAICRSQFTAPDLDTKVLLSESLMVALPPNHLLVGQDRISLHQLRDEKFLLHSAPLGHGISSSILSACQRLGFSPSIRYWGVETVPMLLMVRRGLGIAFAPQSFAGLEISSLPPLVPLVDPEIATHLNLITLKAAHRSMAVQHFIEAVESFPFGVISHSQPSAPEAIEHP